MSTPNSRNSGDLVAQPKIVDVSYKINCVSHISAVTSTYYVDVKLFLHWTDKNFIGRKKNDTVDIRTEGSWNPDIIITNEHQLVSVIEHKEVKVTNSNTGEIKSSVQFRGTLFINVSFFLSILVYVSYFQYFVLFRIWTYRFSHLTAKTFK